MTVEGIVLSERDAGETSKVITLLTAAFGCIDVYVRGGKKSGKSISSTQLFCYSKHSLEEKRGADGVMHYYYRSSEPMNLFYNLRLDAKRTALACYFAELVRFANETGDKAGEVMRLTLNTFYMMNKGDRPLEQLKCIFELRLLCETGYLPALVGCHVCYKVEDDAMHFNLKTGLLTCPEHIADDYSEENGDNGAMYDIVLDKVQLHALRYIALVDQQQLYNFRMSPKYIEWLSGFTERFVEYHYGKKFASLDFYKKL